MQVTETEADGLKHEFKVVVEAQDLERRVQSRLAEIGRSVRLPGFRPGKVPAAVVKQRYGQAVMGEVLEAAVNDSSTEALRERNLRPALKPNIEILSFQEGKDLEYKLAIEALPEVQPMEFSELKLERLRAEVPDEDIDRALERIAQQQRNSEAVERPAEHGDAVVIDFTGRLDGTEFPGGSAKGHALELGSGSFIPGFEDQLVGAAAGEQRTVDVTFPADYGNTDLAGKAAQFEVDVKEVRRITPQPIDESLATAVGMENLQALRDAVREQIERDYGGIARQRLKRALLDKLAERHDFPVPQSMVDLELESIWRQFEQERERAKSRGVAEPEDGKSDDELKGEYRGIAERRVRLGLLLSEVGRRNNIQVTQDELNRALSEEARRFPGQERQVIEFYRNNPGAVDNLRAPIYENKVIDFILEMADVTERSIPAKELLAGDEEDDAETKPEAPADAASPA